MITNFSECDSVTFGGREHLYFRGPSIGKVIVGLQFKGGYGRGLLGSTVAPLDSPPITSQYLSIHKVLLHHSLAEIWSGISDLAASLQSLNQSIDRLINLYFSPACGHRRPLLTWPRSFSQICTHARSIPTPASGNHRGSFEVERQTMRVFRSFTLMVKWHKILVSFVYILQCESINSVPI